VVALSGSIPDYPLPTHSGRVILERAIMESEDTQDLAMLAAIIDKLNLEIDKLNLEILELRGELSDMVKIHDKLEHKIRMRALPMEERYPD